MNMYGFAKFLACSVVVFVLASCIYRRNVRRLRLFLLGIALSISGVMLLDVAELSRPPMGGLTTTTVPTGRPSVFVILFALSRWLMYASLPVFVLACISGAGAYAQCSNCGYNLTGNESGVCPECGEKLASKAG